MCVRECARFWVRESDNFDWYVAGNFNLISTLMATSLIECLAVPLAATSECGREFVCGNKSTVTSSELGRYVRGFEALGHTIRSAPLHGGCYNW